MAFFERLEAPRNLLAEGLYEGLGVGMQEGRQQAKANKQSQLENQFFQGIMNSEQFQKANPFEKAMMIEQGPLSQGSKDRFMNLILEDQRNQYNKMTKFADYSEALGKFIGERYQINDLNPYEKLSPDQKEEVDYILLRAPQLGSERMLSPEQAALLARDEFVKEKQAIAKEEADFKAREMAATKEKQEAIKEFQGLDTLSQIGQILNMQSDKLTKVNAIKNLGATPKEALGIVEGRTKPEDVFKGKKDPAAKSFMDALNKGSVAKGTQQFGKERDVPKKALEYAKKEFEKGSLLTPSVISKLRDMGVKEDILRKVTKEKRKATEEERVEAYSQATKEKMEAYLAERFLEE